MTLTARKVKVVRQFLNRQACPGRSLWTDGTRLYSVGDDASVEIGYRLARSIVLIPRADTTAITRDLRLARQILREHGYVFVEHLEPDGWEHWAPPA